MNTLKWVAAHVAGFGGLIGALYYGLNGDYPNAVTSFLAGLAGFGLSLPVDVQAVLGSLPKK